MARETCLMGPRSRRITRRSLYKLQKMKKNKERKEGREKRAQERDRLGAKAPPKDVPRTIENTCVLDETTVLPDDKEVSKDNANDEFSAYFDSRATPQVLITSTDRPSMKSHFLMKELHKCIPNSSVMLRCGVNLKVLISQANAKAFSDIVVVNEDRKTPNGLLIVHLPDGPSAHFKLTSFQRGYDIKGHGRSTSHQPEIILNHFRTRLGTTVGRFFASLFPHQPQFTGRQVVTFHNQRDYIFFRHHRYIFKNSKRVGMQELGPRFTLKLRSIQKGTFDSKYGEYYWIYKKDDTEKGKKKFYL